MSTIISSKFYWLYFLSFFINCYTQSGEHAFINTLAHYLGHKIDTQDFLYSLAHTTTSTALSVFQDHRACIFSCFPGLCNKLPYISLGTLPTPVQKLKNLGEFLNIPNLYIKRDDLTGKTVFDGTQLFGGNKVRKLEFFLADALYQGAKTVMTFGGVGSNHAAATAIYAHLLGIRCICLLKDQPLSPIVRRNLLLMHHCGAQLHWFPSEQERNNNAAHIFLAHKMAHGDFPCVIPPGASLPIGVVGYVNAIFELKEQITLGLLPTPDYIYVAVGSMGTLAGLLLGIKATHLATNVIAINTDPAQTSETLHEGIATLFNETNTMLHTMDTFFSLYSLHSDDIHILHNYTGKEYGSPCQEGTYCAELMLTYENIILDNTYTAKAFAGLVHHVQEHALQTKTILFWNTWCSNNFAMLLKNSDYKKLPEQLHHYFEQT